jgi:colicin import membrane protein
MREDPWARMLVLSVVMHLVVFAAFCITVKNPGRKLQSLSSYYSVNLVGSIGGGPGPAVSPQSPGKQVAVPAKTEPQPPAKEKKAAPVKTKPVLAKREPDAVSISKKKAPPKEEPARASKQELSSLNERLREMRRRTEPLDVTRSRGGGGAGSGQGGLPMSGSGSGARALDPAMERYILEVWDKIKNAWGLPGTASFKKTLETVVTIRIRKDGRIVDIDVEKRSGNRIYDESILRVLRQVDPLPPIPESLNTDALEVGLRFLPGDLS